MTTTHQLANVASYVRSPEVATAITRFADQLPLKGYLVEPADALGIAKTFKAPGAAAVARVATSAPVLDKLVRDARKGVREALVHNPNLLPDQLEELLLKSLQKDGDGTVITPVAKMLTHERFLAVLERGASQSRVFGDSVADAIRHHLKAGGAEFYEAATRVTGVDPLHDSRQLPAASDPSSDWWEPGMLARLRPQLSATQAGRLLDDLLYRGYVVDTADVEAVPAQPTRMRPDRWPMLADELETPEFAAALGKLGTDWATKLKNSVTSKSQIRARQRRYYPQPRAVAVHDIDMGSWTVTVVNKLAEGFWKDGLRGLGSGTLAEKHTKETAAATLVQANALASKHGFQRYSHRALAFMFPFVATDSPVIEAIGAWANGRLKSQPTPEKIDEMYEIVGPDLSTKLSEVLVEAGCLHMIPGDRLQDIDADRVLRSPALTAAVFTHFLGDATDTWTTALELSLDWDGSMGELIETAAAASDYEMPEFENPVIEVTEDVLPTLF